MTNAEKLKKQMDNRDCVDFFCHHHYCGDCPIYKKSTRKKSCRDWLEEWMGQEVEKMAKKKKKYEVIITRTESVSRSFFVKAASKEEAEELAQTISADTEQDWGMEWGCCFEPEETISCKADPNGSDKDYEKYESYWEEDDDEV